MLQSTSEPRGPQEQQQLQLSQLLERLTRAQSGFALGSLGGLLGSAALPSPAADPMAAASLKLMQRLSGDHTSADFWTSSLDALIQMFRQESEASPLMSLPLLHASG